MLIDHSYFQTWNALLAAAILKIHFQWNLWLFLIQLVDAGSDLWGNMATRSLDPSYGDNKVRWQWQYRPLATRFAAYPGCRWVHLTKRSAFYVDWNSLHLIYFVGNTYNRVCIWCYKYGENRFCERCANKKLWASKHTGLLNSCLGKLCLHPYLVVLLISARVTLISTRVSAHRQAILL